MAERSYPPEPPLPSEPPSAPYVAPGLPVGELSPPERTLLEILHHTAEALVLIDLDERIRWVNRLLYGLRVEQVVGQPFYLLGRGEHRARTRGIFRAVLETRQPQSYEGAYRDASGHETPLLVRMTPLLRGDSVEWVLLTTEDLSRVRRMERERDEAFLRLDVARRTSGVGVWSYTIGEAHFWIDGSLAALLGLGSEALRAPVESFGRFLEEGEAARVEKAVRDALEDTGDGALGSLELRLRTSGGETRWVAFSARIHRDGEGSVYELVGTVLDVTERRSLEEQLRSAQRRELIGQMAAGLAHNFNNALTVIGPSLELALQRAPAVEPLLGRARHAVEQASSLVRELLLLAGARGASEQRRYDPTRGLLDVLELFRSTLRASIELEVHLEPALPELFAVPGQLEQALLNLLLNARDAFEGVSGRQAHIEVRVESEALEGARWLRLSVSDNGMGMDDRVRSRLFEPFFTTKPQGRGTGLGMVTTQAIVREHGGHLRCDSSPGVGTTFVLEVPAAR